MKDYSRCTAVLLLLAAATAYAQAPDKEPQCGGIAETPALALEACTRAIEFGSLARPQLAQAYYNRGTEWANQGKHDRAVADFNMAIELEPKLAVAHYNRALSWSSLGEPDRAIAGYDSVLKLVPNDANARIGRAIELTVKGDYKRAVADYDAVVRVDPNAAAGYFGRARAKYYAGDFFVATSDFIRAHRLDPTIYTALWIYLARKRADIPGEQTLAQEAGTSGTGEWPAPLVGLYLGNTTPQAVQKAAAHQNAERSREQQCEASFYTAQWHLLRNAREPALQLLREAESACPRTFIEHEGALAELRRLQQK